MNTLIIFQKDDDVVPLLTAHGLDMTGGMKVIGGFQTMVSEMTETASAKGPVFGDANEIYTAIVKFTTATLAAVQNDVVEIQIIFMFHQTSGTVARNIINGSRLIEWTHKLQELADDANKHLKVVNVILLSCESAADLIVRPPVRRGLVRAVNQARDMRNAVKSAYKTKQAPPYPSQGTYYPTIVTFSIGNADRGGIVLDPFHAKFSDLDGRFDEDGEWHFNDTENPDRDGEPTAGTIYSDNEASGQSTKPLADNEQENLMGFHP